MAVLQDININVHGQPSEKRLQTFLRLSQNENGRLISFRVLGPPLPSNCTATFSGTKPDGNVYSKAGTVTGNFVVVQEDIQMTAVAGVWDAKLDIINGTHNIMTALIRVVVDADVVDPDAIASDSQLQGLVAEAKYYAEHARTDAYGSPLTATTAAEMTDKTRVYVYTGSETGMTAGNWYYWNGSAWVSGGVYNAVAVQTDTTLSVAGKAADGKATGDAINELKEDLNNKSNRIENEAIQIAGVVEEMECGLTDEVKTALLNCFAKVAWIDTQGQTCYDALEDALNNERTLDSVSAVFNQGSAVIYDTDELYALKQYLTVTAAYSDGTTREVINYTLDGALTTGTSTVTVGYNKKTATFSVTVTHQTKTLESITATFNSSASITTDNVLDDLRPYLTVRALYNDGTTETVSNYTLSGNLNAGTNTITVTYSGKTDTFDVNVTEAQTTLQSISANYSGKQLILSGESVEKLRNGLTVTAHYSDGTDATVTNYTLSGTLAVGTNNIGVAYEGKETVFNVSIPASHYLTASDIESNYGVNLSIDSTGTPTHTSTGEVFFGILFKPSVKKIKCTITEWLDQSHFTLLVNKDGNNVYGIDPGTVNQYVPTERDKLTVASGNTGYTKEADYTTAVIQDFYPVHDWPSIFIPRKDTEIVMELTNGKVTITDIQGNTICYVNAANANRLGYWGSFYLIGTYFTNIVVIGS